ncbi:MAG: hypothetical protein ACQESO_01935 [Bacillota bacterium]
MFIWPDGKSYQCSWEKGYRHGLGTMIYPDDTITEGTWENGRFLDD